MKISLNNACVIEQYLSGTINPATKILFVARLLISSELRRDLYFQKKTYKLLKIYHRKKVKEELEILHQQIFTDLSRLEYQKKILNLFN